MSLVGTRPPTVDEWDKYELHHRARLATKPGLTGMWQVSGRSNITDLRCIRKACLEHVQDNSVSCQQVVEIPEKITQQSRSESPSDISIEINGVVIHIKEDISESLLEKIIRVVSRAK